MRERAPTLTIQYEARTEHRKVKDLEFLIKVVLDKTPRTLNDLEETLDKKEVGVILDVALKDIYRFNEEFGMDNQKHRVESISWEFSDKGNYVVRGEFRIKEGAFKTKIIAKKLLEEVFNQVKSKEESLEMPV